MAKIERHEAFMDTLHNMITKEASTKPTASGKPGQDTHFASVSVATETVDKNKEGKPEHNPQEVKQEPSTDKSDPTKTHKTHKAAEEAAPEVKEAAAVAPQAVSTATPPPAKDAPNKVEQKVATEETPNEKLAALGQQLLNTINEMNKEGTGKPIATGKPGQDTHFASVSVATETVDKNNQGKPETNPQEVKQHPAKDKSDPTKTHKSAEELDLDKEASFELGRQFARAFLSTKTASEENIYKEAGRRDFEALIAQASAELSAEELKSQAKEVYDEAAATGKPVFKHFKKKAEFNEDEQIKLAEEAGAQAFHTMLKQAQEEDQANQIKLAFEQRLNALVNEKNAAENKAAELAAKLAEKEEAIEKQAEEAKLDAKFAQWGGRVVEEVISRLKSEPLVK